MVRTRLCKHRPEKGLRRAISRHAEPLEEILPPPRRVKIVARTSVLPLLVAKMEGSGQMQNIFRKQHTRDMVTDWKDVYP